MPALLPPSLHEGAMAVTWTREDKQEATGGRRQARQDKRGGTPRGGGGERHRGQGRPRRQGGEPLGRHGGPTDSHRRSGSEQRGQALLPIATLL
eukprot:41026-Pyramimonas_sp.AAC.1